MIERAINLVQGGYIEERHIILDTRYAGKKAAESLLKDDRPSGRYSRKQKEGFEGGGGKAG